MNNEYMKITLCEYCEKAVDFLCIDISKCTNNTNHKPDNINHPPHYGGDKDNNPYETIKVIEAWKLGFHLGNVVKYISRAGKKDPTKTVEDLEKASWYLNRKIAKLKASKE